MKYDFSTIVKSLDGKPVVNDDADKTYLTVDKVFVQALLGQDEQGHKLPGTEKFARWELARKINKKSLVDVTVEEIGMLKKVVGELGNPLAVGECWTFLEKSGEPSEEKPANLDA